MRRLGDYELLRKIGSGGMAEVWMGRRAAMAGASKAVAIKLLARDLLDDPSYRDMFIEEARLSMLLTNSNVVQVFDVGEINGECFMVMEWVDGLNLSELSRKMLADGERVPTVVAAHVIGEVLRGLAYAHALHHDGAKATIVHRDVSPHNVLVSVSGEVKLADFGVARLAREETSGMHVKGKLRYMAPEQLRGRSREPTVDLYAVGAILHELLENERFRSTRDEGDLYSMVLSGELPALTVEAPAELERLRTRLLEPDPARRMQSADEALELLYSWPGYRNSALELGKMIRRWVGSGGPRSGIVSTDMLRAGEGVGPSTASVAQTVPADTRQGSAPASAASLGGSQPHEAVTAVESPQESGPSGDRGATHTWVGSGHDESGPTSMISAEPAQRGSAGLMLVVAAMTLAFSFGVFGLGFPLGWWGGGAQSATAGAGDSASSADGGTETGSQVAIAQKSDFPPDPQPDVDEAPDAGTAETGTETGTETGPETGTETETGGESGEDDAGEDDAGAEDDGGTTKTTKTITRPKKEPPAPAGPPADVYLLTNQGSGGFLYVYVRVAGQSFALEPSRSIKLEAGTHRVDLRQDEADPWKKAGKIKVEAGKNYRVRVLSSWKVVLEKL
ncbi:serine/threonine protein kinase [Enhygromyxa salina]|uniref:Serine/threonine protein kinase n=1 Tax=Enhygromyxa salina TaxID=215803 RepID=A0A0C1ZAJ0_9BACT|nr:serine/threonine-protein kinase [Enhygromyxa salina]KIG14649.1 serine/threonine protein kinase [Enhygromyxa salina]